MKLRVLSGAAALALAASAAAGPAVRAAAAVPPASSPGTTRAALPAGAADGNLSSTALSSWETDGTVWAVAYANGVVYAGGQFTHALPPGTPAGTTTGEVPRTYLAAFNSTTGALIASFSPAITGTSSSDGVYALAVSPDGKTLYAGGIFKHVDGVYRDNLAAFSLSTGALTTWAPPAYGKVNTIAPSPDGSKLYIGGAFNELGIPLTARKYAGAVDSSGHVLPWAPALNDAVTSIAVAPDDSQVLVGGYFQTINGVPQNAAGAVDPAAGTRTEPWNANIVPYKPPGCTGAVKDIIIGGSVAYLAAEGTGGGCFDGDFAVSLSLTGGDKLIWQNDCLGATQALAIINGWLFKGSHAHDCAFAPGGFPQVPAGGPGHHLLDQSLTDGTLGHWTPDDNGNPLGPREMATNGSRLFLGGDFTTVNGKPQEGFAIFPAGPDPVHPSNPATAPAVTSTSAGVDSVSFPAVSSRDVGTLKYAVFRDGGTTPVATLTATSWPWALPVLHYQDKGLRPGSSHTYTYTASDGTHTTARSPASARVTVSGKSPSLTYRQTVLADKPSFLWPLDQKSGTTASDASPHRFNGIYEPGTTKGVPGPITGQLATAFDGRSGLVTSARPVNSPGTFSIELWFRTSTNKGGKLAGLGNAQTGASSNYDRQIYMMNDGQLVFGVWPGHNETIETRNVYNDGQWHHVVATLSPTAGLALYVDGGLAGTNPATSDESYTGYWRAGGDNLNGWNLDPWGNSQGTTEPYSYYVNGSIADVAVYPGALSAAHVLAHYAAALHQNK
ncbi:MAG: LamG domain-containing protein [Streptosporangiaceae bacterium]|nr:LamG domain-containing protein [Streptosporangiaceae bacterium]MBV9853669.1 LamG domain-containing protein [Streptosporangiaceae bacterium]